MAEVAWSSRFRPRNLTWQKPHDALAACISRLARSSGLVATGVFPPPRSAGGAVARQVPVHALPGRLWVGEFGFRVAEFVTSRIWGQGCRYQPQAAPNSKDPSMSVKHELCRASSGAGHSSMAKTSWTRRAICFEGNLL